MYVSVCTELRVATNKKNKVVFNKHIYEMLQYPNCNVASLDPSRERETILACIRFKN